MDQVKRAALAISQARLNSAAAGNWELCSAHRERVTRLIVGVGGGTRRRLCILGAGNSNDIDLTAVASAFTETHLFDIDGAALERAVERCHPAHRNRVTLHAGIDLSTTALPSQHSSFDLVVSACLLSQLIDTVASSVAPGDPSRTGAILAIRDAHLRLIFDLVAPGGTALLVSDLVSSDTASQLRHVGDESSDLLPLLLTFITAGNFFTGTNPFAIRALLTSDPALAPHVEHVTLQPPWLWRLSHERVYLVYALSWRRMQSRVTNQS